MDEYDPAAELGLLHDKLLFCSCTGFLQRNNSTRDLCARFIDHGDRLYDTMSIYDDLISYGLNRTDGRSGDTARFIIPFLKAFGMTDHAAMELCRESMRPMDEAERVMRYLIQTLPTIILTNTYEHNAIGLCNGIDVPRANMNCMEVSFDDKEISKQDARLIREMATAITRLRVPAQNRNPGVPGRFSQGEVDLILTLDDIFNVSMKGTAAESMIKTSRVMGANEKTYWVMDMGNHMRIGREGMAFIGGGMTDVMALSTIKEESGLAMSFNGCYSAVKNSNIAVLSRDCTVAAVLVQEFYNEGIEAVYDLVENWDRKTLETKSFPDRNLMRAMLESNKKKLPEVHIVRKDNADEIAEKSDKVRKNLFR